MESSEYYAKAVAWAIDKGITKGRCDDLFDPDADCTRGEVVTFIWRYYSSPAVSSTVKFKDISMDQFYAIPVVWAVQNEVTMGTSDDTFRPEEICTRGQIVTFLYRSRLLK